MNFKNHLYDVLKADARIWNEETKEFNQTLLKDLIDRLDEKIVELLLNDSETKEKFFLKVNDAYILKTQDFKFFIDENKLDNSYTKYRNKIGLRTGSKLLTERDEVVLDWPFKDTILEGGMTKEDQKRNEIFFNEVLAQDEIDRLLDPKALINWKRYTKDGEEKVTELKRDEDGTIRENLIIKGNNLLALHTLKKQFTGKVKLIYIDPPYYFNSTKSEDTFAYNSNFKLSTWLTFMKNRLSVAKDLLSDDGALFVQISDDGVGELMVLLKDIFNNTGENNFINKITVKTKSPSGFASVNPGVFETAEYIIAYAKNKKLWKFNPQYVESEFDTNYKWYIPNKDSNYQDWQVLDLFDHVAKEQGFSGLNEAKKKLHAKVFQEMVSEFAFSNANNIFQSTAIGDNAGAETVRVRDESRENRDKIYKVTRDGRYDIYIINGREMAFYSKKIRSIDGREVPTMQLSNIWTDVPYEGIAREGNVTLKGGKKPEKLVRRIIDIATNPNDIVMDFHVGSGTTAAVAHKLGRQYIGIEQLDDQVEKALRRLSEVINSDTTGISNAVNWQGGGDFVYLELARWNEEAKEKILSATNLEELEKFFDELYERYFLNYNVKTKEFKEKTLKEDEFRNISLDKQKKLFVEMLDMNQMYVNFSERNDSKYNLNSDDIQLSEEFYNSKK